MSDKKKKELLSYLEFVQNKCCENKCCELQERIICWESYREVKRIIQQKPKKKDKP